MCLVSVLKFKVQHVSGPKHAVLNNNLQQKDYLKVLK